MDNPTTTAHAILTKGLRDYLDFCVTQKQLSPKSLRAYQYDIGHFLHFIKDSKLEACNADALQAYFRQLTDKGLRHSSILRKLASLKSYFHYLSESDVLKPNPLQHIKIKSRVPPALPRVMSIAEARSLLLAPRKRILNLVSMNRAFVSSNGMTYTAFSQLQFLVVLELLFATGMRIGEICTLDIADVDLSQQMLRVLGKGNRQRLVSIAQQDVIDVLTYYVNERRKRNHNQPELFINRRGSRLTPDSVRLALRQYLAECGISKRITPHYFRHTAATLLLDAGVDIRIIQELLGHRSIVTTQRYTHVSIQTQRATISNKHPRNALFDPDR